jgi:5-amino-6-(5-phosphoribosylamino)uracil reductase
MSLDGYLDDGTPERLVLSNPADLDRVDALRASCDAILVGASTVRRDNPRLLVRDAGRRAARAARGLAPSPVKATVTSAADLDPASAFFTTGDSERLVYCGSGGVARGSRRLGHLATVVDAGRTVRMQWVSTDLHRRGVRRLLVEGGARVLTQFLAGGLVDELHVAVAPFFVGNPRAHRFVGPGRFPSDADHRAELLEARQVGDVVLMRYALSTPSVDDASTADRPRHVRATP